MLVFPRAGAGLAEAVMHLTLVLGNTAGMDTSIGGHIGLHAAVVNAAVGLPRPGLCGCGLGGRLRSARRLSLCRGFGSFPVVSLLGIGCGRGGDEQREKSCVRTVSRFILGRLLLGASVARALSPLSVTDRAVPCFAEVQKLFNKVDESGAFQLEAQEPILEGGELSSVGAALGVQALVGHAQALDGPAAYQVLLTIAAASSGRTLPYQTASG